MICPKCGAEIPDDSSVCSKCGKEINKMSHDEIMSLVHEINSGKYESSKPHISDYDKKRTVHIISTIIYSIAGAIILLSVIIGILNFNSNYGANKILVALYFCGGIFSGTILLGLGRLVEAAEIYISKNK